MRLVPTNEIKIPELLFYGLEWVKVSSIIIVIMAHSGLWDCGMSCHVIVMVNVMCRVVLMYTLRVKYGGKGKTQLPGVGCPCRADVLHRLRYR